MRTAVSTEDQAGLQSGRLPGREAGAGGVGPGVSTGGGPGMGAPDAGPDASRPIGAVARELGISTRTLRYYEERGLIEAQPRAGGNRRYSLEEIARVVRIRDLQSVMGFNLDEISEVLTAEDALARLRAEWHAGQPTDRRDEIIREALALNHRIQGQVREKLELLERFLDDLRRNERRYRTVARELADERRSPAPSPPRPPRAGPTEGATRR